MRLLRAAAMLAALGAGALRGGDLAEALARGNAALARGEPEAAILEYGNALVDHAEAPELHYDLGVAHLARGDRERAARAFEAAHDLAAAHGDTALQAKAQYNLGLTLAEPGEAAPGPTGAPGRAPGVAGPGGAGGAAGPGGAGGPGAALKDSLAAFQRAIELDPADLDAKVNYQEIRRRLRELTRPEPKPQPGATPPPTPSPSPGATPQPQPQQQAGDRAPSPSPSPAPTQGPSPPPGSDSAKPPPEGGAAPTPAPRPPASPPPAQGAKDAGSAEEQADARVLDALQAEEEQNLRDFLRRRLARPKEVTRDW